MNVKKFIVGGIVGGIVNYLLGWLLWGILFKDTFGSDESKMNMLFIFLGCMTTGFLLSFVFSKWAQISTAMTGLKAGAAISLFLGLFSNFFQNGMNLEPDLKIIGLDIALTVISGALVGAVIGCINGKMK